jgi:threonine aldolase
MRQVGVLCAAAHVAVRDNVGKLADDHRKAKALAGIFFLLKKLSQNWLYPVLRPDFSLF